jgi:thiol-disulfide isomerase/thioredoxin
VVGWKKVHNEHPFGILEIGRVGLAEFGHSPILPDYLKNTLLGTRVASLYFQVSSLKRPPIGTEIGELAPDFTATTLEGETITLSDFRGKIVLVNDFATWCGPCLAKTPHLVDIYNAEGGAVVFIGLNLQETEANVIDYKEQFNISYPLVLDPDGALTEIYRPIGLPTSWFIDSDAVVRYVHTGPMTTPMLQEALDAIREGREPDVFSVAD